MSANPNPDAATRVPALVLWEDFWEALRRGEDARAWLAVHPEAHASTAELLVLASLHDAGRLLLQDSTGGADAVTAPDDSPLLGPGAMVGPWSIDRVLGRGAMGVVYRARHQVLHREGVIKMLPRRLAHEPEAAERFLRSMRILANAEPHPHLATAYDAGEHDGQYYLAMEYVPGPNLDAVVRQQGPLPVERVCAILGQTAAGLEHLARSHIVHRDIKPANLVLTTEGAVKIIDLGLARQETSPLPEEGNTCAETLLGTVDYMAPEQARDPRQADQRSDLYSLGCTAYYLLTGRPPFPDGGRGEKIDAHARAEPVPLCQACPAAPPWLEAVLTRLLAKRPEDRFPTAQALNEALEQGRELDRKPLSQRRRRGIGRLAAVTAAALVGGLLLYWVTDRGTVVLEVNDPNVQVTLRGGGITIHDPASGKKYALTVGPQEVRPGAYTLEVREAPPGLSLSTQAFTLRRGEQVVVEVRLGQNDPAGPPPDPTRQVAKWVLARGGSLVLYHKPFKVSALAQLPTSPVHIQNIDLSGKPVRDEELLDLAGLQNLQGVVLGGTGITDRGMAHLERVTTLKWLYLSRTAVTDAGLKGVTRLVHLENLDLGETGVTDTGLAHLQGLKALRWLRLAKTAVTDAGLLRLRGLTTLKHFDLKGTRVTDQGLEHLLALRQLERLFLGETCVTEEGVHAWNAKRPTCKVQK